MIKFFRKIRQNLLSEGKTGKYIKYAIGEIVLVVIGILIALQINNWNEKQKEKNQLRNIYARVVKDFENSAAEIEIALQEMDATIPIMQRVVREEVNRDSLLTNSDYRRKYFGSTNGFPDIQINDKGVRMIETAIGFNFELNTKYSEALILLYSEFLYEIEVDKFSLTTFFMTLNEYQANKGVRPPLLVKNGENRIADMIFEDDVFKNHLMNYLASYARTRKKLRNFKSQGVDLINKIKIEYHLE